ncbi:MAG: hypothetical protein ABJO27_27970 [Pseudoruegeria sp.]
MSHSKEDATLTLVRKFFHWLAGQAGYKKVLTYSDTRYFNNNRKSARIAHTANEKEAPSPEAAFHAFQAMPSATEFDRLDKALFAFFMLTGARVGAVASLIAYDAGVEKFLAECAAPYRGSLRLGRGSMIFPNRQSSARKFEVGDVVATHTDGNVTIRKHSSGSFTALVDGEPKPARQYLTEIRKSFGTT